MGRRKRPVGVRDALVRGLRARGYFFREIGNVMGLGQEAARNTLENQGPIELEHQKKADEIIDRVCRASSK
mgnify:CR=1 FL=1